MSKMLNVQFLMFNELNQTISKNENFALYN